MVISSFISSILILLLGIWAYARLESSMNSFAERQLLIEPAAFSYKMWKDMPVSMYQSFTFFNLTNWAQVKQSGQKPRFVEVGPYVYKTVWSKAEVNFFDDDKQVSFAERKQWHFQAHLSRGHEDDQIWTINTPLMTALVLIQNAPVITRNIVSLILDGLGEGAFIKRPIRQLLFEGYSDLIVSVGPLFDRRFALFNGKFAYLYNKNDTLDGHWTVSTGREDVSKLNKINRFQSSVVNISSLASGLPPQGLNEVKPECASAWSLDQSTNGQLFAPFSRRAEQLRLEAQLQQTRARPAARSAAEQQQQQQQQSHQHQLQAQHNSPAASIVQAPKRFFSRISGGVGSTSGGGASAGAGANHQNHQQPATAALSQQHEHYLNQQQQLSLQDKLQHLRDVGKFIFYPDLCRPIHLLPGKALVTSENGIEASRYYIDPRVFMNSTQVPSNRCFEMNPRPALANALAATINSVTGANVNVPALVPSGSSPFALFVPPHGQHHSPPFGLFGGGSNSNSAPGQSHSSNGPQYGLFERSNSPASSFINNALQSLSAGANQAADQLAGANSQNSRLGRVRQLFSNIVSQRMSGASPLLPSLSAGPASLLLGGASARHHHHHPHLSVGHTPLASLQPRVANDLAAASASQQQIGRNQAAAMQQQQQPLSPMASPQLAASLEPISFDVANRALNSTSSADQTNLGGAMMTPEQALGVAAQQQQQQQQPFLQPPPVGGNDRWITQFRFKWPRGVFSIGQCQLGAPIYVSQPHFLDADEYYLEQVDGLRPNRSLHEFYIDVESSLHSVPVGAKARLQLNVATPELRFRNIPNAMIPVLWQEVTFKIDKPVATMLYWSFTMASTIYTSVSCLLMAVGATLLVVSLASTIRRQALQRVCSTRAGPSSSSSSSSSSESSNGDSIAPLAAAPLQTDHFNCSDTCSANSVSSRRRGSSASPSNCSRTFSSSPGGSSSGHRRTFGAPLRVAPVAHQTATNGEGHRSSSWRHIQLHEEQLEGNCKLDRGNGATNRAYQSGSELALHKCCDARHAIRSPKQSVEWPTRDWSRASSHCELVSSYGLPSPTVCSAPTSQSATALQGCDAVEGPHVGTAGCLLTCIRHVPQVCSGASGCAVVLAAAAAAATATGTSNARDQYLGTIVRQPHRQQALDSLTTTTSLTTNTTTVSSDTDSKTTLSSARSGGSPSQSVGSCSSIIHACHQPSRTFHNKSSSRATR